MEVLVPSNEQLELYKSLFRVRADVFAIRWEKGSKKGYFPAYHFDPYLYKLHKIKGGTFSNFQEKSYLHLTNNQLIKHFSGEQYIGGYPLFEDNTSYFIAADFDGSKWKTESFRFIEKCLEYSIPAYLERSQSGNGAHVWIFFDRDYPAIRSRKIIIEILVEVGIISPFDTGSSFDRLFPNQDFHSGKGLGNLIALPLHGKSLAKNNSCFIDPKTFEPCISQWDFLKEIKKASISVLESIYENSIQTKASARLGKITSTKLVIDLDNQLHLNRSALTSEITSYLKKELNIPNSEYYVKKKSGKNAWSTRKYFNLIEDTESEVVIPRGFAGKLLRHLRSKGIDYQLNDLRQKKNPIFIQSRIELLEHQKTAHESVEKKDFGIIVAPPGAGKTIIGLRIIADKQQPALIVVHRKQLVEQWIDRINAFLNIPPSEIGMIGSGKNRIGKQITVAMIQSLSKQLQKKPELVDHFGTLIIDECHHIPAETYRSTISSIKSYYQYGLTATPFRKYSDGKLIFIYIGEVIAEISTAEIKSLKRGRIIVRNTDFEFPYNPKTDLFETLSKVLVHDTRRNKLIINDVINELKGGHKAIIITERKDHIDSLTQYLKESSETITLSGEDTPKNRKNKWKKLKNGDYQVLITTGQYFGEGSDLQNVSRLFLAYPFSFKGKLIQYIGRVQRSEVAPVIYDYRDHKVDYLNRLFLKRNVHYRHLDKQATLFDDHLDPILGDRSSVIDTVIRVPFSELDFQYGLIAFRYFVKEMKVELVLEVENLDMRPEFEVLKSYFSKVLKSKTASVHIHAEFKDHQLIAQEASSNDLQRINKEIIESVKFKFIENRFLKKSSLQDVMAGLMNLAKSESLDALYNSEEEFLDDLLENQKVIHYRQLKYLASRHQRDILKLRFVLSPFAFVFLLEGNERFHLVLETLNTEEATYIWHIDKDALKRRLREVDQHLETIRNKGKQFFLDLEPTNFSRVLHDYSDERKGFVIWKDQLEERFN